MMRNLLPRLLVLLVLAVPLAVTTLPATAQPAPSQGPAANAGAGPGPVTLGAYRAHVFDELPARMSIAVDVYDDNPDNLALKERLEQELSTLGLRRGDTHNMLLLVDLRVVEMEAAPGSRSRIRPAGVARFELALPPDGRIVWEAEALFEARDGDIPGGALALVPIVTDTLGQSVELESLDLY